MWSCGLNLHSPHFPTFLSLSDFLSLLLSVLHCLSLSHSLSPSLSLPFLPILCISLSLSPSLCPPDDCWAPLGVQSLPSASFTSSSHQQGHPPWAGRLHGYDYHSDMQGWSPEPHQYHDLPPGAPVGQRAGREPPYLQIDLLKSLNITGTITLQIEHHSYHHITDRTSQAPSHYR